MRQARIRVVRVPSAARPLSPAPAPEWHTRRKLRGHPLVGPLQRVHETGVQVWCDACDAPIDGELLNPDFWHPGREPKWWDYRYRYTAFRFEGGAEGLGQLTWHECSRCYHSYAAA